MNLTSKSAIKNLLKKYRLRPSKGLGQNFLIDKTAVEKIITAADLKLKDIVLEIGPGFGVLTQELAKKIRKVITVEKDSNLARVLNNELRIKKIENVEVILDDIRQILNSKFLILNSYKVIANLPFYLTAPIIRKFLEIKNPPELMVLVVQKEVAQRICAKPPKMNLLAVSVQFYADPKIISYVPKKSFWPQPKVTAAIIKIVPRINNYTPDELFIKEFFKIARAGFSQPRKLLINNLSRKLEIDKMKVATWLLKNNIQPSQRAEALSIEDWIKLTKSFKINQ